MLTKKSRNCVPIIHLSKICKHILENNPNVQHQETDKAKASLQKTQYKYEKYDEELHVLERCGSQDI